MASDRCIAHPNCVAGWNPSFNAEFGVLAFKRKIYTTTAIEGTLTGMMSLPPQFSDAVQAAGRIGRKDGTVGMLFVDRLASYNILRYAQS